MEEIRNFYFQRSNGKYIQLAKAVTKQEAMKIMHNFLDKHNYKSYYTRMWCIPEGNKYDVGSHTEFFLWGTVSANELEEEL